MIFLVLHFTLFLNCLHWLVRQTFLMIYLITFIHRVIKFDY